MKSFAESLFPSLQRVQSTRAQSILQYLQFSPGKFVDTSIRDQLCSRVVDYYLPIYSYISYLVEQHRIRDEGPLLLGMSAPQGCGKTTLTGCLEYLFQTESKCCVVMSIDDFYFTGPELDAVATKHCDNGLLRYRGNAGTHDVPLMKKTLRSLQSSSFPVSIPRFDKSMRGGRGDRAEESTWRVVDSKVDIVIVEGWMLGFRPLPIEDLERRATNNPDIPSDIMEINSKLEEYRSVDDMFHNWLVLATRDINVVYNWRLEAEEKMRLAQEKTPGSKSALTPEEVRDFVKRFMPAYHAYLPELYEVGPFSYTDRGRRLTLPEFTLRSLIDEDSSYPKMQEMYGELKVLKVLVNEERSPITAQFL